MLRMIWMPAAVHHSQVRWVVNVPDRYRSTPPVQAGRAASVSTADPASGGAGAADTIVVPVPRATAKGTAATPRNGRLSAVTRSCRPDSPDRATVGSVVAARPALHSPRPRTHPRHPMQRPRRAQTAPSVDVEPFDPAAFPGIDERLRADRGAASERWRALVDGNDT